MRWRPASRSAFACSCSATPLVVSARSRIAGLPASDYASEGQQRTLALALKLGQGKLLENRRGTPPIYLLDDIFGELDPGRRNALMRHLPQGAQKWITSTQLDWLADAGSLADMARFRIAGGKCLPQ